MLPNADVPTRVQLVSRAIELGRAGAAAAPEHWSPTWLATMFDARARAEVFTAPDVRVCGTLAPGVTATPADGGVVLNVNGSWEAAGPARWRVAVVQHESAVLVPAADPRTGELFVPAHRVLSLSTVGIGRVVAAWATPQAGVIVGRALDALDAYFEALVTDHGPTFAGDSGMFQPAMAHIQTANALAMLAEAEDHAYRLATRVDTTTDWTEDDTAKARADLTATCRLTGDAGYLLATVGGATPIRRAARDLSAATHRALADFDAALSGGRQGRTVA